MNKLAIIDYGAGNLASVIAALSHLGCEAFVASHADDLQNEGNAVQALILPGVGNGAYMMRELERRNFVSMLKQWAEEDKPLLGICVGAQVLLSMTHEGNAPCLDIIRGECRAFVADAAFQENNAHAYKIPHMGWNDVVPSAEHAAHPLFRGVAHHTSFYFVNSYYLHTPEKNCALAHTDYGIFFASVIGRGKVLGVQFHPEKSGEQGMALLRNFLTHIAGVL